MALDSCKISDLKSKSGGGGLIETFKGLVGFVVRICGLLEKIGNGIFSRVSMDSVGSKSRVLCFSSCVHGLDKITKVGVLFRQTSLKIGVFNSH